MNNKSNYKKGKRKELTELLLQLGGIPMRCIPLITEAKKAEASMRNQIYIMIQNKDLIVTDRGQNKVITFNYAKEASNLGCIDKKLMSYYETYAKQDSYEMQSIKNDHHFMTVRNSETSLFLYGIGIKTKITEKVNLLEITNSQEASYYNPQELKSANEYSTERIGGDITGKTRSNGIVISPGGNYIIYDAYNQMFKIDLGETRLKMYAEEILLQRNLKLIKGCTLLFKDGASIKKYMYGVNQRNKENLSHEKLAFTYPKVYALTLDRNGQRLMKLMTAEGWEERLYNSFLEDTEKTSYEDMVCDGKDEDGNYYLVFCSPDIKKLKDFVRGAVAKGEKEKCRIICFDFQKDFISKVAEGYCKIYVANFDEYIEEVGKE